MSINLMTPQCILKLPFSKAPHRIFYGKEKNQFGDLRIPKTQGPHSTIVIIHGGCWLAKLGDLNFMSPFSEALTKKGFATWNIEYRRIGESGGGWPGTFQDVGSAIDYLRELAPKYNLKLDNFLVAGHSSGGHLALWSAARKNLCKTSVLYEKAPLLPKAVINIAGTGDLKDFEHLDEKVCGQPVIAELVGQTHYQEASPYCLLPLGIKQVLISGTHDEAVPTFLMKKYQLKAQQLKDDIKLLTIPDTGHFEFISPKTTAFKKVIKEIEKFF